MTLRIVDAHTHLFPPDVINRRTAYLARDRWFNICYENPSVVLASPEDIVASMDRAGVQKSVICGFPWADPGLCREHNDWMAKACQQYPERLAFLAIVVPHSSGAVSEAERAFGLGAVGIGELNADAQGFELTAPQTMRPLMEVCKAHGKAVMLHSSEPLGHHYPGKGSAWPDRLVTWLGEYPSQPVVLAHWGGGLPFYELMPEVRAVTQFVAYDSAATTYLYNHSVFSHVANLVGPERVLFGTDYPILRQDRLVRRVARQFDDETILQMVYGANAERIYGLQSEGDDRR